MSADLNNRSVLIHDLEKEHQNNLHQTDRIVFDEGARLLQLQTLTLRDDNSVLNERLVQRDERINFLAREADKTRLELDYQRTNGHSKDTQLKKQAVELASLRAEVGRLNATIEESAKVVQEKFALARELDRLRPEMEHLQSQLTDYQTVVAQKHDLQQRVNSLQIELENKKQSMRHNRNHDAETDAILSELRCKLEEAEKQAAINRKERDEIKLNHERERSEVHSLTKRLEERISTLEAKLDDAQSELRETQAELQTCRASLREARIGLQKPQDIRKELSSVKSPKIKKQEPKKSKDEVAVRTPSKDDTIKRPARKRATEQALLGEKSTFSITPFLNKTKNLLDNPNGEMPDSLLAGDDPEAISHEQDVRLPPQIIDESSGPAIFLKSHSFDEEGAVKKTQKARGRPRMKRLSEAPSSEKNGLVPSAKSALDKVVEEPDQERQERGGQPSATNTENPGTSGNIDIAVTNGKKKRKLLGGANKNLFEEDDGEMVPKSTKVPLGPPRRLKAPLGNAVNAFAATGSFSPLKRDRRGVNASFLA